MMDTPKNPTGCQNNKASLLSLPAEIRLKIYDQVIPDGFEIYTNTPKEWPSLSLYHPQPNGNFHRFCDCRLASRGRCTRAASSLSPCNASRRLCQSALLWQGPWGWSNQNLEDQRRRLEAIKSLMKTCRLLHNEVGYGLYQKAEFHFLVGHAGCSCGPTAFQDFFKDNELNMKLVRRLCIRPDFPHDITPYEAPLHLRAQLVQEWRQEEKRKLESLLFQLPALEELYILVESSHSYHPTNDRRRNNPHSLRKKQISLDFGRWLPDNLSPSLQASLQITVGCGCRPRQKGRPCMIVCDCGDNVLVSFVCLELSLYNTR